MERSNDGGDGECKEMMLLMLLVAVGARAWWFHITFTRSVSFKSWNYCSS